MRALASAFALLLLTTIAHAEQVPCLEWCRQCSPGTGCTTNCLLENQPMHAPGCGPAKTSTQATPAPKGVPCYDWCAKCKPDDKACPGRCDKQGKPLMTRACPGH